MAEKEATKGKQEPQKQEWEKSKDQQTPVFRFEKKGDEIVGTITSRFNYKNSWGNNGCGYKISTKDGQFTLFGRKSLDRQMESIKDGQAIKIVYNGEVADSKGKMRHNYDVFVPKGASANA